MYGNGYTAEGHRKLEIGMKKRKTRKDGEKGRRKETKSKGQKNGRGGKMNQKK
jgi:hypothetical protein